MILHHMMRAAAKKLKLIASSGNSARTISVPSAVRIGDLIVFASFGEESYTSAYPTVSLTSGFTQQTIDETGPGTATSGRIRYVLAYRISDGTEGGDSIQAFADATGHYWSTVLVFRHLEALTSVGAGSAFDAGGDDTGQQISYTAHLQDLPFICVVAAAVVRSLALENVSISNDNLTPVYYRAVDQISLRVFLRQFVIPAAETMTSTVTGTEYNLMNITTLLPG